MMKVCSIVLSLKYVPVTSLENKGDGDDTLERKREGVLYIGLKRKP
jgi:hypothetical protein